MMELELDYLVKVRLVLKVDRTGIFIFLYPLITTTYSKDLKKTYIMNYQFRFQMHHLEQLLKFRLSMEENLRLKSLQELNMENNLG